MSEMFKSYPIKIDGSDLNPIINSLSFTSGDACLNYEALVREVLEQLDKPNTVSQKVLKAFPKNKMVVIVPWNDDDAKQYGICNATSSDATILEAGNARVRFTPTTWRPGATCSLSSGGIGTKSDEILLHELIHALRQVSGRFVQVPLNKADKAYDDIEELIAILVTNIYMSEKGNTKFRKDHAGFQELPARWSSSETFANDPDFYYWIDFFYTTEKPLCQQLAQLPSPPRFNPFKAYLDAENAREAAAFAG